MWIINGFTLTIHIILYMEYLGRMRYLRNRMDIYGISKEYNGISGNVGRISLNNIWNIM